MYLTRGFLNPTSRDVHRDLADPVELHRTLLRAFPSHLGAEPRRAAGVLYRLDAGPSGALLVLQSKLAPALAELPAGYFLSETDERLPDVGWPAHPRIDEVDPGAFAVAGARLVFRLRANTTRKIDTRTRPDGQTSNGRRVPVRGDDGRLAWLARRGERDGFRVLEARVREERPQRGRRSGADLTHAGATFDGLLQVTDVVAFRKAVETGIGPAKAFGFGLLSIRPA